MATPMIKAWSIMNVMDKDSFVLSDETVLANQGAYWQATSLDLAIKDV